MRLMQTLPWWDRVEKARSQLCCGLNTSQLCWLLTKCVEGAASVLGL